MGEEKIANEIDEYFRFLLFSCMFVTDRDQHNSFVKGPTDLQEEQEDGSKGDWTSIEQPRWICFLACQLFSSTFSVIWCAGYSQTVIPVLYIMQYILK